ncbi:GNAT family N-acetyltransferase [Sinorhizobium meliloti]|uniref:GNAT family N-acetyltransferase n=1 Tax=Rhizobium meliloti TaxID=382 RepID=UPI000EFBD217|nr:GNAT family N-acetyltransferase [Sinorhizobium meliloti]RMC65320.1 GNAT family N-acetyltransferase [Sinorhizobium meliloti]RVH13482.1 GNAT family N-acetyltransferase [Sinorhizobium meliloti]RVH21171.1 GNAT family N-acetyltransferase [Sinorhizobium meliloti]RVI12339.1 GNAT family N-acetyltransferase [Sinorhizobium meliloti]RVN86848.1 GNAT family N-acetyltransferase [Sinorhizobium meliloti]
MIRLEPPLRVATEADARALADLVNFAGEGLPLYIWEGLAKDEQEPWEVGCARQIEKLREGQILVVDFGDGAVASLTGYPIGSEPKPIGDDFPALFRPLQELENRALESWYVNVLACYPEYRGQGLGSRLLTIAEQIAREEALRRMSVIVANNNAGARRLYERHGFEVAATLPCVKDGWETDTEYWMLLIKSLCPVEGR